MLKRGLLKKKLNGKIGGKARDSIDINTMGIFLNLTRTYN